MFHSCLQLQSEKFRPVITEPEYSKWIFLTTSRISEYPTAPGDLSSGIKSRERVAMNSNSCNAKFKKESCYTSTVPIRLHDKLHKHRDKCGGEGVARGGAVG